MNRYLLLCAACALPACDDDSTGEPRDHVIAAYGEAFVEDHIPPDETDGWRIEFESLIVLVSDVQAGSAALEGVHAIELTAASDGVGHELGVLAGGPFTQLGYRIAPADSAIPVNLSTDQVQPLLDNGWSIRVEGVATKDTQTIGFTWGFATDTDYQACQTAPTAVDAGTVRSLLTIHADHFFYDDLVSDSPNVAFELVASADADADGEVTMSELAAIDITGLARYQVGSNGDITDLAAFIEAQSRTLGHIDGEGHCDATE